LVSAFSHHRNFEPLMNVDGLSGANGLIEAGKWMSEIPAASSMHLRASAFMCGFDASSRRVKSFVCFVGCQSAARPVATGTWLSALEG
jgi:hypothetical protein